MILNKSDTRITRRSLLATCAALSTLAVWRATTAHSGDDASTLWSFAQRLMRNINLAADLPTHTPVPATVRNDWSDLQLTTHLSRILDIKPDMLGQYSHMSDGALQTYLRQRIENNYRQGELIQLQGWWLSATEYLAFLLTTKALI